MAGSPHMAITLRVYSVVLGQPHQNSSMNLGRRWKPFAKSASPLTLLRRLCSRNASDKCVSSGPALGCSVGCHSASICASSRRCAPNKRREKSATFLLLLLYGVSVHAQPLSSSESEPGLTDVTFVTKYFCSDASGMPGARFNFLINSHSRRTFLRNGGVKFCNSSPALSTWKGKYYPAANFPFADHAIRARFSGGPASFLTGTDE